MEWNESSIDYLSGWEWSFVFCCYCRLWNMGQRPASQPFCFVVTWTRFIQERSKTSTYALLASACLPFFSVGGLEKECLFHREYLQQNKYEQGSKKGKQRSKGTFRWYTKNPTNLHQWNKDRRIGEGSCDTYEKYTMLCYRSDWLRHVIFVQYCR